jgi:cytochrome P450
VEDLLPRLIAEDLGFITPDVVELRRRGIQPDVVVRSERLVDAGSVRKIALFARVVQATGRMMRNLAREKELLLLIDDRFTHYRHLLLPYFMPPHAPRLGQRAPPVM